VQNPAAIRGRAAISAGDERTAERELRGAVEIEQQNWELWRDLARAQFRLAKHDTALLSISRALSLAPQAADAMLLRGQIHLARGSRASALEDARHASSTLDRPSQLQECAILLLRLHELDSAMATAQRAVLLSGHDPDAYTNWAVLAAEAGAQRRVESIFAEGRRRHPNDAPLAQAEAAWLVDRGEFTRAKAAYNALLHVHSRPGLVHLALALLYHQEGALNSAHNHAWLAVSLEGHARADVHYTYIVILRDRSQSRAAAKQLKQAKRRFPHDAGLQRLAATAMLPDPPP